MTEQGKKVWKELENMGWSNEPENMHLEYFEDIVEATKKALTIPVVSQQRELLAFLDWVGKNTPSYSVQKPKQIVQAYLKANCG